MRIAVLLLLFLCLPIQAMAHKVITSVYAAGDMIEGEVGLSNGEMAKGKLVTVSGPEGEPLGQVTTDDEGFFTFRPEKAVEHHFRCDLGSGHVGFAVLSVEELPARLHMAATTPKPQQTRPGAEPAVASATLNPEEIAAVVRAEIRPIRREIAALKETRDMQSILGGIGYIVGLFGVGFYLAARRRLKATQHG